MEGVWRRLRKDQYCHFKKIRTHEKKKWQKTDKRHKNTANGYSSPNRGLQSFTFTQLGRKMNLGKFICSSESFNVLSFSSNYIQNANKCFCSRLHISFCCRSKNSSILGNEVKQICFRYSLHCSTANLSDLSGFGCLVGFLVSLFVPDC